MSLERRRAGYLQLPTAALFVLLWAFPARAQAPAGGVGVDELADLPIEDLLNLRVETVYAASRLAQEVARAPASVIIVAGADIRRHGFRTLTAFPA